MNVQGVGSLARCSCPTVSSAGRSASTGAAARVQAPPPPPGDGGRGGRPAHLETAADVLGLSTDEVTEALQSGASLADLAQEQGVARTTWSRRWSPRHPRGCRTSAT